MLHNALILASEHKMSAKKPKAHFDYGSFHFPRSTFNNNKYLYVFCGAWLVWCKIREKATTVAQQPPHNQVHIPIDFNKHNRY